MIYKPAVVFYKTSVCPFCRHFTESVYDAYRLRSAIYPMPVEVGLGHEAQFMENAEMKVMPSNAEQEFLAAGTMNKNGPVVPAVKIVSAAQLMDEIERPWVQHDHVFIFPEGSEKDFDKTVIKRLDKMIERRAYIHNKYYKGEM